MSTKGLIYDNRLEIIRVINQSLVMENSSNTKDLFDTAVKSVGKALKCDSCAIVEADEEGILDLINCYKKKQASYMNDVLKSTCDLASESIRRQLTSYAGTEAASNIYYVPIKNPQRSFALMLSFKKQLDLKDLQILEPVSALLSSSVEKAMLKQQLRQQYLSTVKSLVIAMEAKDVYTQGHSQRVANYSKIIGEYMHLKEDEVEELEITGLVHDIGKIGISDSLLTKPIKLTDVEFDTIKQHPEIGTKILKPLGVSENVMMGTLLHHKRYDLKGYPSNMEIDSLPLVPAIIGVADAYDAMTSERTYKKTISKRDALLELKKYKGTQFDPIIVDVMEELVEADMV